MNVGTGQGVSIRQMIEAAERVLGARAPHAMGPRRRGDPPMLVADAGLIERRLGFRTRCSDLDSIIRDAALWQRTRAW